ncbi:NADH:flavin oxidoreductase [Azospirillum agricola]|uniref:NADH:flavin oxidoreductase n=1 Tax=Azospirillum agricola TaxID=1720247 RepID=UPI000A0F37C2|nr:NADH:flavin oxidoreductase [Azospirillum agricola]SMH37891.1 2,4-dienoyl-CoA reductase [Azospirillum lipoferum]
MIDAFSPVTIGPVTLPNRFIRSGANEMMTADCLPTKSLLEFHRRLAAGGVGMTTLAYISVSPDGRTFTNQGVINDRSLPHYRAITDAVHHAGALVSAQITHGGSFAQHRELSTPRAMSASGGIDKIGLMMGRFFQRAMTRTDMDQVRDEFVNAARLSAEAGFDAVELHMGHGYLLNQFISPLSNRRRDAYGGSAEGRARFPAEILAAVKQAVGDRVAVIAKINLYDGVKKGATADDAVITARALEKAGADMLVLSGGRNIEAPWAIFSSPLPLDDFAAMKPGFASMLQFKLLKLATPKSVRFSELYFLEAARKVRRSVSCKLGYVGGVLSLEAAQQVLNEGFDTVVMARSLVHDAALVQRFREDPAHRSGCTACNRCVAVMYGPSGTHCPLTGNMIDARLNSLPAGAMEQ